MREAYFAKEDFRQKRLEFLRGSSGQKDELQKNNSSQEDLIIDYRYSDLLNFAGTTFRGGLFNKFRAIPDQLLNVQEGSPSEDLQEKKGFFNKYTRDVSNLRQNMLKEYLSDFLIFYN